VQSSHYFPDPARARARGAPSLLFIGAAARQAPPPRGRPIERGCSGLTLNLSKPIFYRLRGKRVGLGFPLDPLSPQFDDDIPRRYEPPPRRNNRLPCHFALTSVSVRANISSNVFFPSRCLPKSGDNFYKKSTGRKAGRKLETARLNTKERCTYRRGKIKDKIFYFIYFYIELLTIELFTILTLRFTSSFLHFLCSSQAVRMPIT